MLRLRGHGEAPQHVVELFHKIVHRGANGAEIMLVELLALARRRAEERAAAHHQVLTLGVVLLRDKEVLLLGADVDRNLGRLLSEEGEHALRLLIDGGHRAQKRRFLIERFAGIRAKRRGNAEHFVLDERIARGIPCGISARLERCTQTTIGKARRVGLALDEFFAGEFRDSRAVADRVEERIVLFGRDSRQRLEPMREMRCPVLDGPFLHGMRDGIRHVKIERLALFDGFGQLLVRIRRKTLLHHVLGKDHCAVLLRKIGHARLLRLRPIVALKRRRRLTLQCVLRKHPLFNNRLL